MKTSAFLLLALLTLSGCTLANDRHISSGTATSHAVRTVAGDINVGENAQMRTMHAVAGDIRVGAGATTRGLSSTAGDIDIGTDVTVNGRVKSTAGDITIRRGARVTEFVASTAGDIELEGCQVDGEVRLTAGRLLTRNANLPGGVVVRHSRWMNNEQPNRIEIGPNTVVAAISVDPRSDIILRISRDAEVGEITGATPEYY